MALDERIRVEEVMSTPLETISADATVMDAANRIRRNDISALVVTTDPPSIVTSTDVLHAAADAVTTDHVEQSFNPARD